jgi:hypothetical protein
VSFRLTDTVVLVDPASGAITWRWGPGEISHQHDAQWLDNGHVLLFDNGTHRRGMPSFSRIVEVDPATKTIVWSHVDEPILATFSFMVSGCQRLPNGNTFFVEGATGRMVEVTPKGATVWEWINPWLLPTFFGRASVVFRAFRIARSDPRLAGLELDGDRYAHVNELFASGRRLDQRDEERMARAVGHRLTRRTPPKPE